MKAKFGAVIVGGSGKIGGHVITKNRAGYAMRTKVTPSNPNTQYQANVRSRLVAISQAWSSLTEAQRLAWNNAVDAFKKTNVFGDLVTPSGFNLYQRLNNNLVTIGIAVIDTPPLPEAVGAMTSMSLAAVNATGAITLTFAPAIGAGDTFKVFATTSINPGKSFVKNQFRLIGTIDSTDASPLDIKTMYDAKFGAVGAAGQKIFVQVVGVNKTTGQEGIEGQAFAFIS